MQESMPSASTSTFIRPSASMSSLSHSMKVRSAMAALPIGTVSSRRAGVSTKPPTCCDRWRGKPMQLVREVDRLADGGVCGIEPRLPDVLVRQLLAPAAPDRVGQRRGDVVGQAQRLADLADRHARPVVDDGASDRGALAAVASVEVLDHFLAPLVLEIDVDVGRLVAIRGDEAGEQRIDLVRVDGGDAEADSRRRSSQPSRGPGRGCPCSLRTRRRRRR